MMKNFKKIALSVLGVAVLTVGFIGCDSDDNTSKNQDSEKANNQENSIRTLSVYSISDLDLDKEVKLSKSTNLVSELLYQFGATRIEVYDIPDGTSQYQVNTQREFNINGTNFNLADYTFSLKGKILTSSNIKNNKKVQLSLIKGEPVEVEEGEIVRISKESIKKSELVVGLIIMKEMVLDSNVKATVTTYNEQSSGCSFWDRYWVNAVGITRTESIQTFEDGIGDYTNPGGSAHGCREYGEPSTSCVWDNHLCITTQTFCCD